MDWLSPVVIIGIAAVALFSIIIGKVRNDPPAAIALSTAGYVILLLGLGWAVNLGDAAFYAAGGASLGGILMTMGIERGRAAKAARDRSATTAGGV